MLQDERHALEAAARETIERIRRDRALCSAWLFRVLTYVEENLFDWRLNASQVRRACRIHDNSWATRFQKEIGVGPRDYIEDRRMETVCRLFVDTDLRLWKIGKMVGYSTQRIFSRAFRRWSGLTASEYRKQARETRQADGVFRFLTSETLERAVVGRLTEPESRDLRAHLASLYPASFSEAKSEDSGKKTSKKVANWNLPAAINLREALGEAFFRPENLDRIRAEEAWNVIRHRPFEQQRQIVTERLRFQTSALVDLLIEAYPRDGRSDRARGVRIAELALLSLSSIERGSLDQDQLANLTARTWAHLGNAYRLNYEHLDAEKAMIAAERSLPNNPDPTTVAEIWYLKSGLCWSQRRLDEALMLDDKAIEALRGLEDSRLLTKALINRGIILETMDRSIEGVPALEEALDSAVDLSDPFLRYSATQNLVSTLLAAGLADRAAGYVTSMQDLAMQIGTPTAIAQCKWIEGSLAQEKGDLEQAERCFSEVRTRFIATNAPGHGALITVDLALVLCAQGRVLEATDLISETVVTFRALGWDLETTAGLRILQSLETMNHLSDVVLKEARRRMKSGSQPSS